MKHAIVIVNTGTPRSSARRDVARFLRRFLNDKHVVNLPLVARALLVNGLIIPCRLRKSARRYHDFFGSGTLSLSAQMQQLEAQLNARLPEGSRAFAAMRYSHPSIEKTLREVQQGGFEKITLIPLFPQYADATTGSVVEAWEKFKKSKFTTPQLADKLKAVESFHDFPPYIRAVSESLQAFDLDSYDHILFSYHSLPLCQVERERNAARCYPTACETTTRLVAEQLELPQNRYTTCFQSNMGKRWLAPFASDLLRRLAREGKKRLLLISPGLVADCLETTHELGVESAALFRQHGGETLDIVPCLNSREAWVEAVVRLSEQSSRPSMM